MTHLERKHITYGKELRGQTLGPGCVVNACLLWNGAMCRDLVPGSWLSTMRDFQVAEILGVRQCLKNEL